MTDRDALIRCILESPNDDLPRLIFADWLEEHGEAARAEFIRVQCELARTNPVIVELVGSMSSRKWEAPEYRRVDELRRRERELWDSTGSYRWFGDEWLGWVLGPGVNHRTRQSGNLTRGFISSISCSWSDFIRVLGPGVNHRTRQSGNLTRGFISSISCSWSDFIRVSESLIWSPKQTVECPNNVEPGICARDGGCDLCGTTGRIPRPFTRSARCEACGGRGSDRHKGIEVPCGCNACSGRGAVERPLAETAQPITDVVFSYDEDENGNWILLPMNGPEIACFTRVKCETCGGHGSFDSGGSTPWGEPVDVACPDCRTPPNSWTCPAWPGVKFAMPEAEPEMPWMGAGVVTGSRPATSARPR